MHIRRRSSLLPTETTPPEEGNTRLALLVLELQVRALALLLHNSVLT